MKKIRPVRYEYNDDGFKLLFEITKSNRVRLMKPNGQNDFQFDVSSTKMIKTFGEALQAIGDYIEFKKMDEAPVVYSKDYKYKPITLGE